MVSWSTIQAAGLFLGPLLLPRIIGYYRSIQAQRKDPRLQQRIKQPALNTRLGLGILFLSALLALFSTLPIFSPPNIFTLTSSRLLTSTNVLFTRLATLRPLTALDKRLQQIFDAAKLDARLFYALYGPHIVANCPLTTPDALDAERTIFLYALPDLAAPHLAHLLILGLATSDTLVGRDAAQWRPFAVLAGLALGAAEIYFVATYDRRANARSTRVSDIDFVYWKLRVFRGLAMAVLDAVLGWIVWAQASGRAFWLGSPLTPAERVGEQMRRLDDLLARLRGLGVVANTVARDASARKRIEGYWMREAEVMREVMEQPQVLSSQRGALARLDMNRIEQEAATFADAILNLNTRPTQA